MQKQFLLIISLVLIFASLSVAQISMVDETGNPIQDGDVFIFNNTGSESDLKVVITNNSNETININLIAEEINGTDGSLFAFCFGNYCFTSITEGLVYGPKTLEAGASTYENEVHFHNSDTDNDIITYDLKIFEQGNESNAIAFTYKYDANFVSVDQLSQEEVRIYPNPAKTIIHISSDNYDEIVFIDMAGQVIKRLKNHQNTISTAEFPNGIYFYQLKRDNRIIQTSKIIVAN